MNLRTIGVLIMISTAGTTLPSVEGTNRWQITARRAAEICRRTWSRVALLATVAIGAIVFATVFITGGEAAASEGQLQEYREVVKEVGLFEELGDAFAGVADENHGGIGELLVIGMLQAFNYFSDDDF